MDEKKGRRFVQQRVVADQTMRVKQKTDRICDAPLWFIPNECRRDHDSHRLQCISNDVDERGLDVEVFFLGMVRLLVVAMAVCVTMVAAASVRVTMIVIGHVFIFVAAAMRMTVRATPCVRMTVMVVLLQQRVAAFFLLRLRRTVRMTVVTAGKTAVGMTMAALLDTRTMQQEQRESKRHVSKSKTHTEHKQATATRLRCVSLCSLQ